MANSVSPMRIALFNQFFWPDTSATSQILTDVSRFLAKKNEVIAVCAGNGAVANEDEFEVPVNLSVVRTLSTDFSRRAHERVFSYLSYLACCLLWGLTSKRLDVYVTLTTPPILPFIGSLLSIMRTSSHVIWEMDVYPDIATDIAYLKPGGLLDRISGCLLDWSRRRAAAIIVLGEEMRNRLKARGIPETKIHVVENWANGEEITPQPFPSGPIIIQYSGNLGLAHETWTIQQTIERLANHKDFRFMFVGGGPRRTSLEDFCRSRAISNVEFRPYCRRFELGASLSQSHLGLVTQLPQTLGSVVPSKIYGIMAAGRPLLYIGPAQSTPAHHIREYECGWHIEPGDLNALESLLFQLRDNPHLIVEFGERARRVFEMRFDSAVSLAAIKRIVENSSLA